MSPCLIIATKHRGSRRPLKKTQTKITDNNRTKGPTRAAFRLDANSLFIYRRHSIIILISNSIVVRSISFQNFFVQAFKIVVDSGKFIMLLLYILWDDWPIFMISGSNEQLQQELEYTLLKPDCHSWRISKMHSGREDTLKECYAINLEKMPQKPMECFRLLLDNLAWIEHQFLSGIRDSRKAGSLWGMMRGVGRARKSIDHSWLAKGLGLGLLCWGFKGVQE